jgi:hypothetical protein
VNRGTKRARDSAARTSENPLKAKLLEHTLDS